MITLRSGDSIQGSASSAAKITYTIFGFLKTTGSYRVLAQGQLGTGVAALITATEDTLVSTIILVNTDSVSRNYTLYVNGSAAANQINGTVTLGPGYRLTITSAGIQVTDTSGQALIGQSPSGAAGGDLSGTYPNPTVVAGAITLTKMANMSTDRLLGRDTAASGVPEEVSVSGGLEWTGGPGIQRSALTGDATASAGSNALTLANAAVTLAKMANLAANSIMGNNTGAGATPLALTAAQVKTLLAIAQADVTGLGTADSPQHAAINLGHATDTTITRLSAGLIAVEGALVQEFRGMINPTIAGTVNDYAPAGLATCSYLHIGMGGAARIMTGLSATGFVEGQEFWISHDGSAANQLTVNFASASSASGNRITTPGAANFVISNGSVCKIIYMPSVNAANPFRLVSGI